MHRTTILLPVDLKQKADATAHVLGISLGEFVRKAILLAIGNSQKTTRQSDPLFSDKTFFKGKAPKDLSLNHDFYLYGGQYGEK